MPALRGGKKSGLLKRADSVLAPIIRNLGIENSVRLAQIQAHWHTLFQQPLSLHLWPSQLSSDELVLNVDSPVWMQELAFHKQTIIERLTPYRIKTVRFRLGRVSTSAHGEKRERAARRALTPAEYSFLEETLTSVGDRDLKEVLKRVVEKSLTVRGRH